MTMSRSIAALSAAVTLVSKDPFSPPQFHDELVSLAGISGIQDEILDIVHKYCTE